MNFTFKNIYFNELMGSDSLFTKKRGKYFLIFICFLLFFHTPNGQVLIKRFQKAPRSVSAGRLLAPIITASPQNQTDCKSNTVSFSTSYTSSGTVTYQWQSSTDGVNWTDIGTWPNIVGASGSSSSSPIVLKVAKIGVGGTNGVNMSGTHYRVIITDMNGSLTSNSATLTVNQITSISAGSTNTTTTVICEGSSFTFTVSTSGSTPTSYQWLKNLVPLSNGTTNGITISGANTATLMVTNASSAESGSYKVDVFFNVIDGSGISKTCNERSSNFTRNVTVNPKPTPTITHN